MTGDSVLVGTTRIDLGPFGAAVAGVLGGSGGNADDWTAEFAGGSLSATSLVDDCAGTEMLSMPGVDFLAMALGAGVTDATLLGVATTFLLAAMARGPEGIAASFAFPFSNTGKSSR